MEHKTAIAGEIFQGQVAQAAGREKRAVRLCQVVLLAVLCLRSCFCGPLMKREGLEGGLSPVCEGAMHLLRMKVFMKHGKDAHMRERNVEEMQMG